MRALFRLTPAALAVLALCACGDNARNSLAGDPPGSERIIAREAKPAPGAAGKPGIELHVDGQRFFFDIGQSNGYRDSGMGDVSVSLQASRFDGQKGAAAEVTLAHLRPVEGSQRVGEGERQPMHIQLVGVPGRDGALRSVQGELQVEALRMDENNRFKTIDARFSGRFSAYSANSEAFIDPAHADGIDISGRLVIERN